MLFPPTERRKFKIIPLATVIWWLKFLFQSNARAESWDLKVSPLNWFYEERLSGIQTTPSAKDISRKKFKSNKLNWPRIYQLPRSTCVHSKTRIFQYKILNNILYLNTILYRMGLSISPLCSLCSLSDETTTHLFSECNMSLALWKEIQNKAKGVLNLPNIKYHNAHLCFLTEESGSMHLHNQIQLSYKQFLLEHRKIKQSINIIEFWNIWKWFVKLNWRWQKRMTNLRVKTCFENGITEGSASLLQFTWS